MSEETTASSAAVTTSLRVPEKTGHSGSLVKTPPTHTPSWFYSQFGFSQHWWRLFAGQFQIEVFIRVVRGVPLFVLLILGEFEVHSQADSGAGAGVSVVCQGACFQAGVRRRVRQRDHTRAAVRGCQGGLGMGASV